MTRIPTTRVGRIALATAVAAALGLGGCGDSEETAPAAHWDHVGSMNEPRSYFPLVLLDSGRALAVGGQAGDIWATSSTELYDPIPGTWSAGPVTTVPRMGHVAVKLPSGKVLAAGGWDGLEAAHGSAELYDPVAGAFSDTGAMGTPRILPAAALLPSGKVLVAGGFAGPGTTPLATAELYDPATGSFTPTGSMATPRAWTTAVALPSGKVLVSGGGVDWDFTNTTASAELYDPATGTWTSAGSMPRRGAGHTATLLRSGKVLVVGGCVRDGACGPMDNLAWLYDPAVPAATAWTEAARPTYGRLGHVARLLDTGEVMVAAGDVDMGDFGQTEVWNPESDSWSFGVEMMTRHGNGPGAVVLQGGDWLVAGGIRWLSGALIDVGASETFTP